MKLKNITSIIFAVIISLIAIIFTNNASNKQNIPIEGYRVYLNGEAIGLIKSKEELENYIDKQQEALKKQYQVDKVYIPNGINIVKDITYDEKIDSVSEIYNEISEKSPFTIRGYEVVIDRTNSTIYENDDVEEIETLENVKVYVLNKEIFTKAVEDVILSYVPSETYEAYVEDTQVEIITTGEVVENIYIEDEITIKETNISTSEKIYTNVEELTKYLIFGDNTSQKTYVVKQGDSVEKVADTNKMSVTALTIANPSIYGENSLLYAGQKLSVGTLNPIFNVVVEKHIVSDQVVDFKTDIKYDKKYKQGYSKVTQEGVDGVNRVTQKVKTINGEVSQAYIVSSTEITPTVNKIVIKGGTQAKRGDGEWEWPTKYPYILSSKYGYRAFSNSFHRGIDICGTGYGSPIYAARDGVVTYVGDQGAGYGYNVIIKHENGYYTRYAHMRNIKGNDAGGSEGSYVKYGIKVGTEVKAKQIIGEMGNSGRSFGFHLHFEIWDGPPQNGVSNSYNPLLFY